MKSIEGWYETPAHGAKPSFRAPQANLKDCELAYRCCADGRELVATAQVGSIRAPMNHNDREAL